MVVGVTDYCLPGSDAVHRRPCLPTKTPQPYAILVSSLRAALLAHFHLLDHIRLRVQITNPLLDLRFSQRYGAKLRFL